MLAAQPEKREQTGTMAPTPYMTLAEASGSFFFTSHFFSFLDV